MMHSIPLQECEAWNNEREELQRVVGRDLSLSTLIRVMVNDSNAWDAVVKFAAKVMKKKEERDRERQEGERQRERANRLKASLEGNVDAPHGGVDSDDSDEWD